ncbi:hypothetical protein M0802_016692 [Mischocyttarus mexicanus]|nr:hypothetical protein M0802_016692 [Mischocyttarus mexicanus]
MVASGFSQRKVNVKAKQNDRQRSQGSKKLLVQFSQALLKNKKRLIKDRSTTVGVYFSKNIKRLLQGFLSEKLSEMLRKSQNKVLGREAQFRRSFQYSLVMVNSWIRHGLSKINHQLLEFFFSKNNKKFHQGFLSEKLR